MRKPLKTILTVAGIGMISLTGCSELSTSMDDALDSISSSSSSQSTPDAVTDGSCTKDNGRFDRVGCFGEPWADVDGNGCDTRNDILARDLQNVTYRDSKRCVVDSGVLVNEPYTGKTIDFKRGAKTSSAVQIDHVYPVHAAYKDGATNWTAQKRLEFANDPLNLIASDGPANASKSDDTLSEWESNPAFTNTAYKCEYAKRYKQVTDKYELPFTKADQRAMDKSCN